MKKFLILFIIFSTFTAAAQSGYCTCYINNMESGNTAFKQGKYSLAKNYYITAKKCSGGDPVEAQRKINACNAKIQERQESVSVSSTPSSGSYSQSERYELDKAKQSYNNEQYAEALPIFRKYAEKGYSEAQNYLGVMYNYGQGVTQDLYEAVHWYRKAAEQGYSVAQYNLEYMYENGKGVSQDKSLAIEWYRKAASQGYEFAKKALNRLGTTW